MIIPDKDHPVWKILQGVISLLGLIIFLFHTDIHGDVAGVAGVGGAVHLLYKMSRA